MQTSDIPVSKEKEPDKAHRFIQSLEKAVNYMSSLELEQLDVLRISTKTVHWLQQRVEMGQVSVHENRNKNATFRMFSKNTKDLMIKAAPGFENISDEALDYATMFWVKDIDQYIKGKQNFAQTPLEDLDDKLWHGTSENELKITEDVISAVLQFGMPKRTFMASQLCRNAYTASIGPFFSALAHRQIAHRADHFAAKVTGTTFATYIANVKEVIPYEPVEQSIKHFFSGCDPSDKKRTFNTAETVAQSTDFRNRNHISIYKSGF